MTASLAVPSVVQPRTPTFHEIEDTPDWWHMNGHYLAITHHDAFAGWYRLITNGATVTIYAVHDQEHLCIEWEVRFSQREKAKGTVLLTPNQMRAAFGFSDECEEGSAFLVEKYGGTCAKQGRFIRWKNCLNVPCPGTGRDGDPNVSIELTPEIKAAVKELLDRLPPQEHP